MVTGFDLVLLVFTIWWCWLSSGCWAGLVGWLLLVVGICWGLFCVFDFGCFDFGWIGVWVMLLIGVSWVLILKGLV